MMRVSVGLGRSRTDMSLSQLLDTASFRRLQLIELLNYDDTWQTIDRLSNELACSRRTMITDIQSINNYIGNKLFIKTSKQRGVKLITSDQFHIEEVYQDFVENSLNFQILKKIIELDVTTYEDLSELLFTSPSSINRSLKQINTFLVKYNLSIQSNPIKIIGTEEQIRYFYSIFLCQYCSSTIDNFEHSLKETASHFLEQLEKERKTYPYSFLTHYRTLIWMIVCSDRISKGYLIEKEYRTPNRVNLKMLQSISRLTKELPFELPKKELAFMLYIYWDNHQEFDTNDLDNEPSMKSLHQDILFLIEKIKEETGYSLEDQSFLINNLMGYCFYRNFFTGPSNLLFNPKKNLLEASLTLFDEFINTVKKMVEYFPQDSLIHDLQLDDFIFNVIVFWKGLVAQVHSKKEKIQILVISYLGMGQEQLISDMLQVRFPTLINCHLASEQSSYRKGIQLVLTDHSVKHMKQERYLSKKVIGIDAILTKRDWKRIEQMINTLK